MAINLFKNKKGVLFTVVVIILLSVIIFKLTIETETRLKEKRLPIETRVNTVDDFIGDLERDISRGLYIASFRALLGLQQKVTEQGVYVTDLNSSFNELVINGTYEGVYVDVIDQAEMSEWIERIGEKAEELLIDVDYDILDVRVAHVTSWVIRIYIDVVLEITDTKGTASWLRESTITADIDITGFEDPLYTINSNGGIIKTIVRTNITDFVTDIDDTTNLLTHLGGSYYATSNISPSYLNRLEGNLRPSEFGIESLVDLREFEDLEAYGITIKDDCSIVDFVYFNSSCSDIDNYLINNTYSWFRMDDIQVNASSGHLDLYEVRDLVIAG